MTNIPRHDLDEAIGRVAAKMVAIDPDAGGLQAVLARLPERESKPWFLRLPVQAAAAVALLLVAFVWARPIDRPAMPRAVSPIAATVPPLVAARMMVPVAEGSDVRVPARVSPIPDPGSPIPDPGSPIPEDHERSLAPVATFQAIAVSEIAAPAIEIAAPASLEPLVLTDLSLEIKGDSECAAFMSA